MAKGNLFLGQARGKVGSVVFARAFGEQITRTRPTSVANPKTIGQNTQRAILATIAKSAAAMTSLVDHSFAGIAYGAESVRHFRKINMGLLRNLYMNTQNDANLVAKGGNFVPNPLKVSEGNLPQFVSIVDDGDIGFLQDAAHPLPTSGDILVSQFLLAFPYLQGGDQITLVKINKVNDGELINGDALFTMSLDRIVFAPDAFDDPNAVILAEDDPIITESLLDLTKTTNPACLGLNVATGGLGFSTDHDVYYAALILSRKVNNGWQRSTQYLEQIEFDDHTDNQAAIDSYGATSSLVEATEYLNQAEEGSPATGVKGAYANFAVMANGQGVFEDDLTAGEVDTSAVGIPASSNFALKVTGFGTGDKRLVTCEIAGPDNVLLAHDPKSARWGANWQAESAGAYKLTALFADGTRAEYTITLSQQA